MTNTKKLAEKAAKFLYPLLKMVNPPQITEGYLFYDDVRSSHLAHLAKREMEKLGFVWSTKTNLNNGKYGSCFFKYSTEVGFEFPLSIWHENEYIALWLAIEKTGVMDVSS